MNGENISIEQNPSMRLVTRRKFIWDAGTMVMFAGTPYAHLHIWGSPWEGNEYRRGDRGVWTMRYERP